MPGFDIAVLDTLTRSQEGVPMPVLHPATRQVIMLEDGRPWTITLCGRSSDAHRSVMREIEAGRADRLARGQQPTPEDIERDNNRVLVACTKGWTTVLRDAVPFEYSHDNARTLWSDRRFAWLRDQAIRFIQDDANFLAS